MNEEIKEILQEFKHYFTHEVKKLDNMTDENYIKAIIDSFKNLQNILRGSDEK